MEYRVVWTIDIDAETPTDAARKALEIHRNPDSWATHFEVRDSRGHIQEVDLGYPTECVLPQTVYLLVPMDDGIVRGVEAFASEEAAERAQNEWLSVNGLSDEMDREHASDCGTGIAVWECEVKG